MRVEGMIWWTDGQKCTRGWCLYDCTCFYCMIEIPWPAEAEEDLGRCGDQDGRRDRRVNQLFDFCHYSHTMGNL